MSENRESDARAIIDTVERLTVPHKVDLDGDTDLLVVPSMRTGVPAQVVDLKPYRDARLTAPERRTGTVNVTSLDSFIDVVNRFCDEDSAIFVDNAARNPRLICVLDYHRHGADGAPRFGTHRVEYAFPLSDEWKAWTAIATDSVKQDALAEFLEDHIGDVLAPESVGAKLQAQMEQLGFTLAGPSTLIALSRGLSVHVGSKVATHANLSTGEAQVSFEETHAASDKAGNQVRIPGGFALAIPVFRAGALYQVPVRLRYRVSSGSITWRLMLSRTDLVFADAISGAADQASKLTGVPQEPAGRTGLPLYYGTPEG